MNQETILIVDDEPNVASGITRKLHGQFTFEVAAGGAEALERLRVNPQIAVMMTDLQMPGMNGLELLAKAQKLAPDCVRLMLSGNADLNATIQAVNEGQVFRFLTKPCETDHLSQMLQAALSQYRLITAERTLLEKTLNGSVQVLMEIMSLFDPEIFGRSQSVRSIARVMGNHLKADSWSLEVAAMLARISMVTLPHDLLIRERSGEELTIIEREVFQRIPQTSSSLISQIPRMEEVSTIIQYQNKSFDGKGFPFDDRKGADIPLGARVLKVAADFVQLTSCGKPGGKVLESMKLSIGTYDPEILEVLAAHLLEIQKGPVSKVPKIRILHHIKDLLPGQVTRSKIETVDGMLIVGEGQVLQNPLIHKIFNFSELYQLKMPIHIEDTLE